MHGRGRLVVSSGSVIGNGDSNSKNTINIMIVK
jgi:hypothetical protein